MRRAVFIFALILFGHVLADMSPGVYPEPIECYEGVEEMLLRGNAEFTGNFLYEALKAKPNESSILSAFSVLIPLAELALYAEGDTLNQLLKVLNLPDKFHIRCVFPRAISILKSEGDVILNAPSRIFATSQYPLSQDFLNDTKQVFHAEAENFNFLEPEAAANHINEWVQKETNGRIKDIASSDMFDDTRLVLANAIRFQGDWIKQFDPKHTKSRPFHLNNEKSVDVSTMFIEEYFKYGENSKLDCKVLEIFNKRGDYSLAVFLPNKIDGLADMVEKLKDQRNFFQAYDNIAYEKVKVHLPKMKLESEYDLIPIMKTAGITDLVDSNKSILNGVLEQYAPLYISVAKQKSSGEVDETGTEAVAANVFVGAVMTSIIVDPPVVQDFDANHPFSFYIMNKRNIIFSGVFKK